MRTKPAAGLALACVIALTGCTDTVFDPVSGPDVTGGPVLTFQGAVRSSADGSPVAGAKIRLYAPGPPFQFPFTVASTVTTTGGSYLLRLPTAFGSADTCDIWRLSARAAGFDGEEEVGGIACTSEAQEIDFALTPR